MLFWIVFQIGVVDSSYFPEGQEGNDPVFNAFYQTLNFHHRCNISNKHLGLLEVFRFIRENQLVSLQC